MSTKPKYNWKEPSLFPEDHLHPDTMEYRGVKKVTNKHGKDVNVAVITKTKEYFVEQARAVWGDLYDYSDSVYTNNKEPIIIYCPKHDYHFRVAMAQNHVMKPHGTFKPTGCPVCRAEELHGREYGKDWRQYLKVCAKNNRVGKIGYRRLTPEEIEQCRAKADAEREERKRKRKEEKALRKQAYQERLQRQKEQTRQRHEAERAERILQKGLHKQQRILDLQDYFRKEAPKMQGEGYVYKGIERITSKSSRVFVHCPNPDHEWHPMLVSLILQGCKCRECAGRHQPVEQRREKFRQQVISKHGEKRFRIAFAEYINNDTPIDVHCNIHHYDYKTTPDNLLRKTGGCPFCTASEGEATIKVWLDNHNIPHTWHAQLPNEDPTLPLQYVEPDFMLNDYHGHDIAIEYHGKQHYEDIPYFYQGKSRNLQLQQQRDRYLINYCRSHDIWLIEIPYWDHDRIDEILTDCLLPKKR